jgi:hypothetical protein
VATVVQGVIAAGSEAPADVVGGDYPAFHGAGGIALEGEWDALYDIERQAESQRGLHADEGDVWYFAYPPQVAAVYAPFATLPYSLAYLLHTAVMAGLLLGSILLARPMVGWLAGRELIAMAAAMTFWPMFRAVTGGSNTALTLFLVVASWRLIEERHHVLGGVVASMLLYKPTFAIPLIGLYLVSRHWRVVAGAVSGAVVFVVWGVVISGPAWMSQWLGAATEFGVIDAEVNGHSAISVVGFAENLAGGAMPMMTAVAWLLALAMVGVLCWIWWIGDARHLDVMLAIAMPGIVFLSPHAMSHDGGVVLLTVAVAIGTWASASWAPWVATVWALGAATIFMKPLGFSPGFVGLLVVLAWVAIPIRDRDRWLVSP